MHLRLASFFALSVATVLMGACAAPASEGDDAETSEHAEVSDIVKMTARGDGTFDVECKGGRHEVVTADDVKAGRVCKPAEFPASPFQVGACTGTPITEAGLAAKLGSATSKKVGSFVYAIRLRDSQWSWNGKRWDARYSWKDAPTDSLAAWKDGAYGASVVFTKRGDVELARDAKGSPTIRLIGEAANLPGPDTTQFVRYVFGAFQPFKSYYGVEPKLEQSTGGGEGSWAPIPYGWFVSTQRKEVANFNYVFGYGYQGSVQIVTETCGQITTGDQLGGLSPISARMGIFFVFD